MNGFEEQVSLEELKGGETSDISEQEKKAHDFFAQEQKRRAPFYFRRLNCR